SDMELAHRAIVMLEQGSHEQFAQVESCGLLVLLDEAVQLVMNLAATTYLFVPELSSSVFSSKYSNSPLRSTNDVIGTIFLVSLSSNTYVPAPRAKCIDSSYCGLFVNASTKSVTGEQLGTGNHASLGISPLV